MGYLGIPYCLSGDHWYAIGPTGWYRHFRYMPDQPADLGPLATEIVDQPWWDAKQSHALLGSGPTLTGDE